MDWLRDSRAGRPAGRPNWRLATAARVPRGWLGTPSGTSSVVVARDFGRPRSRAYLSAPGVLYFARYARSTAALRRSLRVCTALIRSSRLPTLMTPTGSASELGTWRHAGPG
jgi:hypothetical protein